MKKTILLFTFLAVNIGAFAQCNQRPNADNYLLQGNTYLHVEEIDLEPFDSNGQVQVVPSYNIGQIALTSRYGQYSNYITDVAQLQHCDALTTIVGVSAFLTQHNYETMNAYLCIADTDFNVYRRVKIPNDSVDCNYTELFFEQPINVNGDFSIIWDNPKNNVSPDIYNFDTTYDFTCDNNNPRLIVSCIWKDTTNCGFFTRITSPDGAIGLWTYYFSDILSSQLTYRFVAYLFPIFGDLDTTLSLVGQPEDTVTQPEDTSSLSGVNIIEKYSHIFPNPVKKELNIQCSFRINDIEIYNSLGQKVFNKEVKGYHTVVKVANFEKGTYYLKINTANGVANKKFIVQ